MSKIAGHYEITRQALKELQDSCPLNPVLARMPTGQSGQKKFRTDNSLIAEAISNHNLDKPTTDPALGAVMRDLRDIVNLGHWREAGQKHHFMRKSASQSASEAYRDACAWIRDNAAQAAQALKDRVVENYSEVHPTWRPGAPVQRGFTTSTCDVEPAPILHNLLGDFTPVGRLSGDNLFTGRPSDLLGNAVHCLQDSFSPSHVARDTEGRIEHVKVYSGAEKKGHGDEDHKWRIGDAEFSDMGRSAIKATKALVVLVLNHALVDLDKPVGDLLEGFFPFQRKWLAVSPKLL